MKEKLYICLGKPKALALDQSKPFSVATAGD